MTSLLSKTIPNYQSKTGQTDNIYLPQPFLNYAGLTKMLSGNYHYVPKEHPNPSEENPNETNQNLDNTLYQQNKFEETKQSSNSKSSQNQQQSSQQQPEQQDGEPQEEDTIGFWINNINTGNVYRSFTKGTNPWARSSAFTQPIQRTRGAFCYYQNAYDSPIGGEGAAGLSAAELKRREEELRKQQEEAERKAREEAELQERIRGAQIGVGGVRNDTSKKILGGCSKKGWTGLSELRCFLHSNTKNNSDVIDKNSFRLLFKKKRYFIRRC